MAAITAAAQKIRRLGWQTQHAGHHHHYRWVSYLNPAYGLPCPYNFLDALRMCVMIVFLPQLQQALMAQTVIVF
jgi:hypothetical protein